MKVAIQGIAPTRESSTYRLLLQVDDLSLAFVVGLQEQPTVGLSAPDSFWRILEPHHRLTPKIGQFVHRFHSGEALTFPIPLVADDAPPHQEPAGAKIWASKSVCHLSPSSLRSAVDHLARRGDTSLFPRAFEYSVIESAWTQLGRFAERVNLLDHRLTGFRQIMAPKSSAGTRMATQLDPLDTILLTAAVFELAPIAERSRVPVSEGVVHSFRFRGESEGSLWDPSVNYGTFQTKTRELLDKPRTAIVAQTDISSFYHRVPVGLAASALERAGADRRLVEGVRRILMSFAESGLPVGPAASAFFAELVLNEADMALLSAGATFVRFNDDYRFFCETESQARKWLQLLTDVLWHGPRLTLQDSKTKISAASSYRAELPPERQWLEQLRNRILETDPYADTTEEELSPDDRELVDSARSVLNQAIDVRHPAWMRLGREAFKSLPLTERLSFMPTVLQQFGRLWPFAREVSWCIAVAGKKQTERETIADVVTQNLERKPVAQEVPDYGLTWLVQSFSSGNWPSMDRLFQAAIDWPVAMAARREVILALRGYPLLARRAKSNPIDPWHRRAIIAVIGKTVSIDAPRSNDRAARIWDSELDSVIAETATKSTGE